MSVRVTQVAPADAGVCSLVVRTSSSGSGVKRYNAYVRSRLLSDLTPDPRYVRLFHNLARADLVPLLCSLSFTKAPRAATAHLPGACMPSPPPAALLAAVALSVSAGLVVLRWRRSRRRALSQPPTEALIKEVVQAEAAPAVHLSRTPSRVSLEDGQSRFGLDIGGSLLKLIYLELDGTHDAVVSSLKVLDQLSSRPGSKRPSRNFDMASTAASLDAESSGEHDGPPVAVLQAACASPGRSSRGVLDPSLTVHVPALGGTLYFAHFATASVEHAVEVLRQHRLTDGLASMQATGGGAHKYRQTFERRLGVSLQPCNELDAVVLGMCLMVKAVPDECYTFERVADPSAADTSDEQAQPVVIPSESLGISQPLRKIHKPFCARHRLNPHPTALAQPADRLALTRAGIVAPVGSQWGWRRLFPLFAVQRRHRRLHPARPVRDLIHARERHGTRRRHLPGPDTPAD